MANAARTIVALHYWAPPNGPQILAMSRSAEVVQAFCAALVAEAQVGVAAAYGSNDHVRLAIAEEDLRRAERVKAVVFAASSVEVVQSAKAATENVVGPIGQ